MSAVARLRKDGQMDIHESDYCGHLFKVSGVFPSTCHQGSAQYILVIMWENTAPGTEFPLIFCDGIGLLKLSVVLVLKIFSFEKETTKYVN